MTQLISLTHFTLPPSLYMHTHTNPIFNSVGVCMLTISIPTFPLSFSMEHSAKTTVPPTATTHTKLSTSSPPPSSSSSPVLLHHQPSPPPHPSPLPPVVVSPCAACKILRRRCDEKCILAPYFPPTEPHKFTVAHRVFGASNIIKTLQELPEFQRLDAVSSMVYEADARIRDPVYGCAGAIGQLQNQASELQAELAKTKAELVTMQCQHANMVALVCMEMKQSQEQQQLQQQEEAAMIVHHQASYMDTSCFLDDTNFGSAWEPLWA